MEAHAVPSQQRYITEVENVGVEFVMIFHSMLVIILCRTQINFHVKMESVASPIIFLVRKIWAKKVTFRQKLWRQRLIQLRQR